MTDARKHQIEILRRDGYHCAANLLCQINSEAEFDYILNFVQGCDFWGDPCCFQLRALWTAYCLHADIKVDTGTYDSQLAELWNAFIEPGWKSFDDFDNFMCARLV